MIDQYYHTPESVEEYTRMAKGHSGRALIEKLKSFLPSGANLLELGSGPGTDWAILSECFEVTGSDYSEEFVKRLRWNNPTGMFIHLNAATLETSQQFDGVYSNKVLHHLTDADLASSILRQQQILNHGGIICHSFWNGEGSETFKGMFVNYHSEAELRQLFNGFEALLMQPYAEFEANDSLLLIGRKI